MAKSGARSGVKSGIKGGWGQLIWSVSVALYLIANGILGLNKTGQIKAIFDYIFNYSSFGDMVAMIVSVISLFAGILVLFELFKVKFTFLDELLFIVAIIWAVYIVIEVIYWFREGVAEGFWIIVQKLAIDLMVLGSLLIASKRFGG